MISWTDKVKDRAARDGRYLVKIQVQGKHANDGNIEIASDCSREHAERLTQIAMEIIGASK